MKYRELIEYNGRQLFSGAIDIDTYLNSPEKTREIVFSYIFHGKTNHEGELNGHSLTDSITFTEKVLEALDSDTPEILLGIAGYGVGKSHLGLTIASMLSDSNGILRESIVDGIREIDEFAAERISDNFDGDDRPFLVIPINGMRNVNLKDLFFYTIKKVLIKDHVDSSCLDEFDPRFDSLKNTLETNGDREKVKNLLSKFGLSERSFSDAMDNMDADVYSTIKNALPSAGLKFYEPAAIGELKDIISTVAINLCGENKPYRAMLIVFDEFGKYMSFASSNEGTAGPGCMQLLFEGINSHSGIDGHVVMLGLSQLDLKEYQRGSGDVAFTNTMKRYVTRFDSADRYYLSACFETLVSNLIAVNDPSMVPSLASASFNAKVGSVHKALVKYFRQVSNIDVWADEGKFARIICKGCWPLSPYLVWTLSYITSVNNLLQQRSGFNILATLFNEVIYDDDVDGEIPAIALFKAGLLEEFLDSERTFATADSVSMEYHFLLQKYEHKLTSREIAVLEAIVLTHKLKALCDTQSSMNRLIVELSGLSIRSVEAAIESLSGEYNAVSYDATSGFYLIQSDSVSFSQFDQIIQKKVKNYKLTTEPESQFASIDNIFAFSHEASDIKNECLQDIECDFAIDYEISTPEWKYMSSLIIGYDYLEKLKSAINVEEIKARVDFNASRGQIFYVLLPKTVSAKGAKEKIEEILRVKAVQYGTILPVMVLLLSDENDVILNNCIEISLMDSFTQEESDKFSSLILKQKNRLFGEIRNTIENQKQKKNYVYPECIKSNQPLKLAGESIFEEIYPSVIPFFIDGTNWMSSVQKFIDIFSRGSFSWNDIQNTNDTKFINRARTLLSKDWQIVGSKGVGRTPKQETLEAIFDGIDEILEGGYSVYVFDLYQKLLQPPYGANTTSASLILFLYLSCRYHEIDISKKGDLIDLSSFASAKNSLAKNKGLVKGVWEDVLFRKAVRDDAKWITLINQWSDETKLLSLIDDLHQAQQLQENNISLPSHLSTRFAECVNRSKQANELLEVWNANAILVKEKIQSCINQERVGKPLRMYVTEYLPLYNNTIEKGKNLKSQIIFPDEIVSEDESFRELVCTYIDGNIDTWIAEHPLSFSARKTDFDQTVSDYDRVIKHLNTAGLNLVANDLSADLDECKAKRKAYIEFKSAERKALDELDSIKDTIKIGIFSSAQVISNLNRLKELLKYIDEFNQEKLNLLSECSFSAIKNDIQGSIDYLNSIGSQKDKEFEELFNIDVETVDNLDYIINVTSELISFYKGLGDIKNDNLDDAQIMRNEATLLKEAYNKMSSSSLSVAELKDIALDFKNKFEAEFSDDAIFADGEIIDTFEKEIEEDTISRAVIWVEQVRNNLSKAQTVNDIDRVIFLLDSAPNYTAGVVVSEIESVRGSALSKKGEMKLDYIKSLFDELTDKEKAMFLSWCKYSSH